MSKLTDDLRRKAIVNAHDFAYAHGPQNDLYPGDRPRPPRLVVKGMDRHAVPTISYSAHDRWTSARWSVSIPGRDLERPDQRNVVYGYGAAKQFPLYDHNGSHSEIKAAALQAALAWASKEFGVEEWTRTPWGCYMPAVFVAERLAQLNAYEPEAL